MGKRVKPGINAEGEAKFTFGQTEKQSGGETRDCKAALISRAVSDGKGVLCDANGRRWGTGRGERKYPRKDVPSR
jgi:hypothetical protein